MTDDLVKETPQGKIPGMPSIEDIFGQMNGWDQLMKTPASKQLDDGLKKRNEDLQRDYAATFSSPHGRRVLEDILDQTLRRPVVHPAGTLTLEQHLPFALERNGQNNLAFYVCSAFHKGMQLPSPGAKKNKKAA